MTVNLVIVNQSTEVTDPVAVHAIAAACDTQLRNHVAPAWGRRTGKVTVATPTTIPAGAVPLYLLDDPDQQGALGYHDEDSAGRQYGRIFVRPILTHGGTLLDGPLSVAAVCSHEVCEWFIDPTCQGWESVLPGRLLARELCDPVEQDSYRMNAVSVSNFVLPAYFDPSDKGPYDHMGRLTKPGTMTAGGYLIQMVEGKVGQVFAAAAPPAWRMETKRAPGSRTGRRTT